MFLLVECIFQQLYSRAQVKTSYLSPLKPEIAMQILQTALLATEGTFPARDLLGREKMWSSLSEYSYVRLGVCYWKGC